METGATDVPGAETGLGTGGGVRSGVKSLDEGAEEAGGSGPGWS